MASVRSKKEKNLEASLSRALKPSETIDLTKSQIFRLGDENEAHKWTAETVSNYVASAVELPQYQQHISNNCITGSKFITLTSYKDIMRAMSMGEADGNMLHVKKIKSHIDKLRSKVLSAAVEKLPPRFKTWGTSHIAGWLEYIHQCPNCCNVILLSKLTGADINNKFYADIVLLFQMCNPDECEVALSAIQPYCARDIAAELDGKNIDDVIGDILASPREAADVPESDGIEASGKTKKKKGKKKKKSSSRGLVPVEGIGYNSKRETALTRRRNKELAERGEDTNESETERETQPSSSDYDSTAPPPMKASEEVRIPGITKESTSSSPGNRSFMMRIWLPMQRKIP